MMKISKLVLLIIVSFALWGCAANVSSGDTAKDWGNVAPNSNVFRLPIILKNNYHNHICYKGQKNRFNLTTTNKVRINPNRVGGFITNYPVIMQAKEMLVGIHIIPYLVNKINANRHYLIPNFGWITGQIPPFSRFYPACHSYSMDQKTAKIANYLSYYPLILLKVASKKQRDLLVKHLQNLNFQARHLGEAYAKVRTISQLIQNIFQTERAKFLEGLPFNVCLQLLDEKNVLRNKVEFTVVNNRNLPSPCNSSTLLTKSTDIAKIVKQVKSCDKSLVSQIENARAKLEQIINQNQTILKENKQYKILKNIVNYRKLAEAIEKVFESHPEVLKLDKKLVKCEESKKNIKQHKTKILWNKKITPNRHKLIVVSLAKFSKQQQTAIRESLIEVLSTLNRNYLQVSLRTIQAGRELSTALLTSAELGNTWFIKAKIGNLQFGATDLIALNDLGLVDSIIQEQEGSSDSIGKVLYITDNANLNGKPPNKQRGVILAWYEDKIRLTVLTTAECGLWNNYMKAQCNSWRTKKQLENALKKFLYY